MPEENLMEGIFNCAYLRCLVTLELHAFEVLTIVTKENSKLYFKAIFTWFWLHIN
jgi:hypothetical protein